MQRIKNYNDAMCGLTLFPDSPSVIEWILKKGVSVDLRAHSTGYTPLHYAAYHYQKSKMVILLENHADPAARGLADETPLHLLVCLEYRQAEEGVAALLGASADINAQDDRGNTPLHWALGANSDRDWLHRGNAESIRSLLAKGADPNVKNAKKLSPSAMAKKSRNLKFQDAFKEGVR